MYLWKYHASANWLAAQEDELQETSPGEVAVIELAGKARALVQVTCGSQVQAHRLVRRFGGAMEKLPRDWQRQYLTAEGRAPVRIGKRLVVVSELAPDEKTAQLVIPAAGAFGTGGHATTAMCIRMLEETSRELPAGWSIVDAGTGTGILALAARCFGAKEVLGIDHDPRAVAHARANARLNKIRGVEFVSLDFLRWKPPRRYDVITANLFSELLIAALPLFRRVMAPAGRLILSGILREQAPDVTKAVRAAEWQIETERRRGKWVALRAMQGSPARHRQRGALQDHAKQVARRAATARKTRLKAR